MIFPTVLFALGWGLLAGVLQYFLNIKNIGLFLDIIGGGIIYLLFFN